MDIKNLPSPIEDVNYSITSFEYLADLKVIELLWILCPQQRRVAYDSLVLKTHFLKSQFEKDPTLEKESNNKMKEWAISYIKNDKVIWFYLEQSYELKVKDFIKGFSNVMNVLKKEETFINHATTEQKQFLDLVLNSTLCKIISTDGIPSSWDWIMLMIQLSSNSKINSSDRTSWIGMKMIRLAIRMVFQPKKQNKMLELFQQYFDVLFGDYMLEVNLHYQFNYLYHQGDLKNIFDSSEAENKESNEESVQSNDSLNITNAQLVLIYYYFFKQYGLEPRKNIDISPLARFIHLATDTTFTKVQNSEIYTKLSKAPNFKNDKELLKDLNVIRPLFEKYGFSDILQSIDNEIIRVKREPYI